MFSREAEAGHSSFFFGGGGLLLSPEAATHIPGQPWSYAACAWIIHWHSSPGRLVHSAPWEGAAHGASSLRLTGRTGEVLCHPRPTLVRWTILLLSANRDPVTYRPNINNRASTLPPPLPFWFGNLNRPPQSTALLQQRDGSGSLRVGGSVFGQLHHTKPRKQASKHAGSWHEYWYMTGGYCRLKLEEMPRFSKPSLLWFGLLCSPHHLIGDWRVRLTVKMDLCNSNNPHK